MKLCSNSLKCKTLNELRVFTFRKYLNKWALIQKKSGHETVAPIIVSNRLPFSMYLPSSSWMDILSAATTDLPISPMQKIKCQCKSDCKSCNCSCRHLSLHFSEDCFSEDWWRFDYLTNLCENFDFD